MDGQSESENCMKAVFVRYNQILLGI